LELIHAYSNARLARANGLAYAASGQIIPGTKLLFSLATVGWVLYSSATNGFDANFARENITVDLNDGIDPARTQSYWITCGWKWTSRSTASVPATAIYLGNVAIATVNQVFALAGGVPGAQVAFIELAYNPITKEIRLYVNGNRLAGTFTFDNSVLRVYVARNVVYNVTYFLGDIYVGRFEGNEEPCMRRWTLTTLAPATNGIGANIDKVDGQVVSVQGTELTATYAIPAGTLAVAVDVSAESVGNAGDLVTRVTDGATTSTVRQSTFTGALGTLANVSVNPYDYRGHGMVGGTVKPGSGAGTLTVGVKALDRV